MARARALRRRRRSCGRGCTGSRRTPASTCFAAGRAGAAAPSVPAADSDRAAVAAADLPWLQPYPDRLLDQSRRPRSEPDAVVVARETIELAFLAAIQQLPPRQRAVLILRDVLGWPAKDTAALLEASVASVNSALQRARATLRERLPERRTEWAAAAGAERGGARAAAPLHGRARARRPRRARGSCCARTRG